MPKVSRDTLEKSLERMPTILEELFLRRQRPRKGLECWIATANQEPFTHITTEYTLRRLCYSNTQGILWLATIDETLGFDPKTQRAETKVSTILTRVAPRILETCPIYNPENLFEIGQRTPYNSESTALREYFKLQREDTF